MPPSPARARYPATDPATAPATDHGSAGSATNSPHRQQHWSPTRHKLLRACLRAVYWQYWGSRGGYSRDADRETQQAWALKHLGSLPTVIGIAVHQAFRALVVAIRDGEPAPSQAALLAGARHVLNHAWRSSQPDAIHRFWSYPAAHPALHEIVYRGALRPEDIEHARAKLAACLRHAVVAPVLTDLAQCASTEIVVSGASPERVLVDVDRIAWLALDLAYRHIDPATCRHLVSGPCWCVTDVKTGRPAPADEHLQLSAYALWLEAQGYPPTDDIYLGRIVHLLSGTDTWYTITAEDRAHVRRVIAADTALERAWFGALESGEGRQPGAGRQSGAARRPTTVPSARDRRRCPSCNFFALCRDDLANDMFVNEASANEMSGEATSGNAGAGQQDPPRLGLPTTRGPGTAGSDGPHHRVETDGT